MIKTHLLLTFVLITVMPCGYGQALEYPFLQPDTVQYKVLDQHFDDTFPFLEDYSDPRTTSWLKAQQKLIKNYRKNLPAYFDIREGLIQISEMNTLDIRRPTYTVYSEPSSRPEVHIYVDIIYSTQFDRRPDLHFKRCIWDYIEPQECTDFQLLLSTDQLNYDKDDWVEFESARVSSDQRYMTCNVTHSGSDWREIAVMDLKKKKLIEVLKFCGSIAPIWKGNGFYYTQYDEPVEGRELLDAHKGQRISYHKLLQPQEQDSVVYRNPDTSNKREFFYEQVRRYDELVIYHPHRVQGKWYEAISTMDLNMSVLSMNNFFLLEETDGLETEIVGEPKDDKVILMSNHKHPNGNLFICDLSGTNKLTQITGNYEDVLVSAEIASDWEKITSKYFHHGGYAFLKTNLKGDPLRIDRFKEGFDITELNEVGFRSKETGNWIKGMRYVQKSFYHPPTRFFRNDTTEEIAQWNPKKYKYDADQYKTEYIDFLSKDGTMVPMYLTMKKDLVLGGTNPVLIYAYGGYGMTLEPYFSELFFMFLSQGGILAVPQIRGSGAKGTQWALAGRGWNKQNGIDDFIATAEYLVKEKYSNPSKIAIYGESHGGYVVATAMTQRPEMFRAVISGIGVYDLFRFKNYTVGDALGNNNEFGKVTNQEELALVKKRSPLQLINDKTKYPALLAITGDSDDRVPAVHSYKFMAAVQQMAKDSPHPFLLYVQAFSGHAGTEDYDDYYELMAIKAGFLFKELGMVYDDERLGFKK